MVLTKNCHRVLFMFYWIHTEVFINQKTRMIRNVFWDLDWCYGSLVTIVSHLPFCSTIRKLLNTSTKIFQRLSLSILFAATNLSNRFCFDRIFDEEMFVQKEDLLKIFPARIYHRICQWNVISIKGYCVKNFTTNKLFYM